VSKGWGRGSITVELPTDYDLGIEFSDINFKSISFGYACSLKYTLVWHASQGGSPKKMRWTGYSSKGVKLSDGPLDFGGTITSEEPTKGEILITGEWKEITRIKIDQ
jgi:hypothetical protein